MPTTNTPDGRLCSSSSPGRSSSCEVPSVLVRIRKTTNDLLFLLATLFVGVAGLIVLTFLSLRKRRGD